MLMLLFNFYLSKLDYLCFCIILHCTFFSFQLFPFVTGVDSYFVLLLIWREIALYMKIYSLINPFVPNATIGNEWVKAYVRNG